MPAATRTTPSADPVLDRDAEALHEALSDLVRVYQFRDRDRICCHDISVTQCYALEALLRRGPSTLGDLAAELFLDKSTASRVVAALERKRYVARAAHPQDGRSVVLTVTPAGRRLHDRIRQDLVAEEKRLLEDFEPEVRAGTARLIARLARAAAARAGLGGASCAPSPAACCVVEKE
jgi:MarR family transcriptional regulator, 2-MHQ and catechol-resistance regulon repressor